MNVNNPISPAEMPPPIDAVRFDVVTIRPRFVDSGRIPRGTIVGQMEFAPELTPDAARELFEGVIEIRPPEWSV